MASIIGVGIAVIFAASPSIADGPRVATIDVARIIRESKIGKTAHKKLEAEAAKRREAVDALRAELEKIKDDIAKQEKILSAEALERRRDSLRERETSAMRKVEDERESLERVRREALQSVIERMDREVQKLGEKERYAVIMDRDEAYVVYAASRTDVTDDIIKAMDK